MARANSSLRLFLYRVDACLFGMLVWLLVMHLRLHLVYHRHFVEDGAVLGYLHRSLPLLLIEVIPSGLLSPKRAGRLCASMAEIFFCP